MQKSSASGERSRGERCANGSHAARPRTPGRMLAKDSSVKVALCSSKTLRMTIPGLLLALEMSGQSDEELARRLQRRDPGAMADLYDRFGRLAWSVILAIVRDAATAEDLVQETFLRVWNQAHAFEAGRGALGPWLLADRSQPRHRSRSIEERAHGSQRIRTRRARASVAVRGHGARGSEYRSRPGHPKSDFDSEREATER